MSLDDSFHSACERIKKFETRPPDGDVLEIYGLYKQATIGDLTITKNTEDPIAKAKYDAWVKYKGMECDAAKEQYIAKINELATTYDKVPE